MMADPAEKPNQQLSPDGGFHHLRVWPALLLIATMLFLRYLPKLMTTRPDAVLMAQAMGPAICGILILIWWLCFSRAKWFERIAGLIGVAVSMYMVSLTVDSSMLGVGSMFLTFPMGLAAFGIGATVARHMLNSKRTMVAILFAMIGFGFSALLRMDGMWSDAKVNFDWRWSPSAEDMLVIEKRNANSVVGVTAESAAALARPEWPGFRGADRTGRQGGSVIASHWSKTPEQIWKIAVGPGWSSFAVAGDLLFTQEQRGENEAVVCYDSNSGNELWLYEVKTRFEEAIGGPGPRATPTLANVKAADGNDLPPLFALGANGTLARIDPTTGSEVWRQELQTVAGRKAPTWGYSSSPLVVDSKVIVHAGGPDDKGTLAFDVETGEVVWSAKSGDHSYASPQLSTVLDEDLVLMLSNNGLEILDPIDGNLRLDYEWKYQGYRSLQPQVLDGNTVLLPTNVGMGTRRIQLGPCDDSDDLMAEEIWTSMNLKPDFNDFVVYQDHLYGFDGSIFTCIDLGTGQRAWKGGRYGKGQVLLLEDSGLLLVASEKGQVVMLKADPAGHHELGTFQALKGKTWNHPVVVGDRLFIRNAQEAACYRLPVD